MLQIAVGRVLAAAGEPRRGEADAVTASWMFCTTAPIEARRMRSLLARYSSAHSGEVAAGKAFFQRASASTMNIATVFAM